MSMYGSKDVGAWLVGGYNLLASKLQGFSVSDEAMQAQTDGLGDQWGEFTPTGFRVTTLSQDGAFFDAGAGLAHSVQSPATAPEPRSC